MSETEHHTATDTVIGPPDVGWSSVTLKIYLDQMFSVADRERIAIKTHYDTLLIEYDRRYQARFVASEQAVKDAFAAQEKAINAALAASEKAVLKAETASEKRFEGVNEFRGQLGDQQRTLMPRAEAEALVKALNEKLEAIAIASNQGLSALVARLDRTEGRGQGGHDAYGYMYAAVGVIVAIAGVVVGIVLAIAK